MVTEGLYSLILSRLSPTLSSDCPAEPVQEGSGVGYLQHSFHPRFSPCLVSECSMPWAEPHLASVSSWLQVQLLVPPHPHNHCSITMETWGPTDPSLTPSNLYFWLHVCRSPGKVRLQQLLIWPGCQLPESPTCWRVSQPGRCFPAVYQY